MQKIFIITGLILLGIGLFWPFFSKLPLGRLPGDIVIDKPGLKVFIPITTMILLSIFLTLVFKLLRR